MLTCVNENGLSPFGAGQRMKKRSDFHKVGASGNYQMNFEQELTLFCFYVVKLARIWRISMLNYLVRIAYNTMKVRRYLPS
jgi:hypothetical protein